MRVYSNEQIIEVINSHKQEILKAEIGMDKTWSYTAETIYENGKLTQDLTNNIARSMGTNGSCWDTPVIRIYTKQNVMYQYPAYSEDPALIMIAAKEQEEFRLKVRNEISKILKDIRTK